MCEDKIIVKNLCGNCRSSYDSYDLEGNWENACKKNMEMYSSKIGFVFENGFYYKYPNKDLKELITFLKNL